MMSEPDVSSPYLNTHHCTEDVDDVILALWLYLHSSLTELL